MKFDRTFVERREFDRKAPRDLDIAHGDDDAAHLRLVDISLGGFSVSSNRRFAPGTTRTFDFTSGGVFTMRLSAIAIYSQRHERLDGVVLHTCGFAFVAPTDELRDAIAIVVNGLADGVLPEWPVVSFAEHGVAS
jgi:hypothetical protein